jgi:phosphohistidine phosphatase SixA
MDFILVRHGVRDPEQEDGSMTEHGTHQIKALADQLKLRGTIPDLILTSKQAHAIKTAQILQERIQPPLAPAAAQPIEIDALTPRGGPGDIAELSRQAEQAGADLMKFSCVLAVGHEGRLSDLVTELTSQRIHPVPHGGAVSVRGADLQDLAAGRGCVHHRYPTVDYQEDQLRSKVNSKMTVASLLAGFVLTALSAVLVLDKRPWPGDRVAAIIALTASLALFLASVYIYDQLSTPSGFWTDADQPRWLWQRLADVREARQERRWSEAWAAAERDDECAGIQTDDDSKGRRADDDPKVYRPLHDGPVYWLMVNTSRFVFTPAVFLALAGFVALLIGTNDLRIWMIGLGALAVAAGYAAFHRPALGAD